MSPSEHPTIDGILHRFRKSLALSSGSPLLNMNDGVGATAQQEAKAALAELIAREIIGEDRTNEEEYSSKVTKMQQRQALENQMKGKTDE